jgi:hypothetical protein
VCGQWLMGQLIDPGIWYVGGAIGHSRYFSRFVALQIKAMVMGNPLEVCKKTPEKYAGDKADDEGGEGMVVNGV